MQEIRYRNAIRDLLATGRSALGVTVQTASADIVEMAGRAGFDFVWIDCEHGAFLLEQALQLIRAAEGARMTPVVRVPELDASLVARVLDAGAMGVIVPNLTTRAQAQTLLAATRYKDQGNGGARGACPSVRAASHLTRDWTEFVSWSNANIMAWGTIESLEGVRNIHEILEAGLDGIALGPFDLAHDMGFPGQPGHPEVLRALESVSLAAREKDVPVIATLFSSAEADMRQEQAWWEERGVRIFSTGTDRGLIVTAMEARVRANRASPQIAAMVV